MRNVKVTLSSDYNQCIERSERRTKGGEGGVKSENSFQQKNEVKSLLRKILLKGTIPENRSGQPKEYPLIAHL